MKRPTAAQVALFVGLALLVTGGIAVAHANRSRTLAVVHDPDGTSKAVIGKSRLCGLMGIEVVLEYRSREGIVTYSSAHDLLSSWDEVERRYSNPGGGGLLVPLADVEPEVDALKTE